jgi:hypothetical protein
MDRGGNRIAIGIGPRDSGFGTKDGRPASGFGLPDQALHGGGRIVNKLMSYYGER